MASIRKKTYTQVTQSGEVKMNPDGEHEAQKQYTVSREYANLGFYLVFPLLVSIFVGRWADAKYGTDGLYTIIGVLFGTIIMFYHLVKLYKQDGSAH